jgi:catechol-2,3-dioxygenase
MADGSHLAFFDLGDDVAAEPSPNTPAWVNHIALRVDSPETLRAAKARLEAAGVEVIGVTDHHIIESIYFFDPNGIRLELTGADRERRDDRASTSRRRMPRSRPGRRRSATGLRAAEASDGLAREAAANLSNYGAMDA